MNPERAAGVSILVCVNRRSTGVACGNRGGELIAARLEQLIAQRGWPVVVERIRCLGECARGPNARIAPGAEMRNGLSPEDLTPLLAALERFLAGSGAKADTG